MLLRHRIWMSNQGNTTPHNWTIRRISPCSRDENASGPLTNWEGRGCTIADLLVPLRTAAKTFLANGRRRDISSPYIVHRQLVAEGATTSNRVRIFSPSTARSATPGNR